MTNDFTVAVAFTRLEDGTHVAASVVTPLFCVSAETYEEVKAKAERVIAFWAAHRNEIAQRPEHPVTPFAPQHVEKLPAFA